jgi:outer membrane protein assembly factor BamD (BamD/ComL family)
VGEAKRRVEELMSVSGFATAVAVVNGLLAKHPSSAEAIALLERVRREREAFVDEQRLAMYRKVEKEAFSRRWRDALSAAEELLSAYPDSPEADAVRARMDTLRENARIEEVRRLRDRVSDLISRRQFAQAIEVAKDVIARFPATAAARELHEQMAKLEELGRAAPGAGQ